MRGTSGASEHHIARKKFGKYYNTAKKNGRYSNFIVEVCIAGGFVDARAKIEAITSRGTMETMTLL